MVERLINARSIADIKKHTPVSTGLPRKPKITDQVCMEVQLRIMDMYKSGISMRRIGEQLYSEKIPHPDTTVPWSTEAIAAIIKERKNDQ
jgi:hypothetical protein